VIGLGGNTAVLDAEVASGPIACHAASIRDQVASEGRTTRALPSPSD
jgi:tartrate dehydratase alpha subunit/fumarate hydratase class I-like protein